MVFKVLIEAAKIPSLSKVTKRTGTNEFVLRRDLRIYSKQDGKEVVEAKDGCVFLVNPNGDVNVYPPSTELLWHVEPDDLLRYLKEWLHPESHK